MENASGRTVRRRLHDAWIWEGRVPLSVDKDILGRDGRFSCVLPKGQT